MTTRVVGKITCLSLFMGLFFGLTSCEKDIENVGVNLIDNNTFSTDTHTAGLNSSSVNIANVNGYKLNQYLLGVYTDENFGKLEASFVTQLVNPLSGSSYSDKFGNATKIDSVLVSIPYQATKTENDASGKPVFEIDSVFGNTARPFKLEIFRLKTFLNTLDPNNPAKEQVYYTDKDFLKENEGMPLYSGEFLVRPNDTVAYIKRHSKDGLTVYDIDTIKESDLSPTIKIPLDEALVKQWFVDNASGPEFNNFEAFTAYFKGLYFEASSLINESHLISLDLNGSKMSIYYSYEQDEEEEEDLDGDGNTGETAVWLAGDMQFTFGTLRSSIYKRDYSLATGRKADRLYLQGAAGEMATLNLFDETELQELRENNWLITDATLNLFIDQEVSQPIIPGRLFLYNFDEKKQLLDNYTEPGGIRGELIYDSEGNPYKYEFSITNYISEVLKADGLELNELGLKVYNSTDALNQNNLSIPNFSWTPKGVVLLNENAGEKGMSLELSYTKLNNE